MKRGPKPKSLIGHIFGNLTVISHDPYSVAYVTVECACGRIKSINKYHLTRNRREVHSCGSAHKMQYSNFPPKKLKKPKNCKHAAAIKYPNGGWYCPDCELAELRITYFAEIRNMPE